MRLFYIGDEYFTHVSDVVRAVFEDTTMEMAMLLKPKALVVKEKGDPEQLAKDWDNYVKVFQEFFGATGIAGVHANPEVVDSPCAACVKAKCMLRLVWGDQVWTLLDHVGMVSDIDGWEGTLEKVFRGIQQQTNQAAARFKLMEKMPQSNRCFAEWFTLVKWEMTPLVLAE